MKYLSFVLCALLLLVGVGATSAQVDTRTASNQFISSNSTLGVSLSTLPSSGNYADIRSGNTVTDVNDPIHPCRSGSASAGGYSVFTRITFPGGTLSANTAASNYDTVLSVFNGAGSLVNGTALACSDDVNNSTTTSALSVTLPAGSYIVMASSYATSVSASALNLKLNLSYTPDVPAPANDVYTAPIVLTTGVQVTQTTGIQHLTDDATEAGLNANCAMYNSAWYSFTAPERGSYIFTSYGSSFLQNSSLVNTNTLVAVYTSGPGSLVQCSTLSSVAGVTAAIDMFGGTTYLIRVGTPYNYNLLPGSRYKMKAIAVRSMVIKSNVDFGLLGSSEGWKTKNWDAGDSFTGGYATMNAGALKKSLTQSRISFPKYIKFVKGGTVELLGYYFYTGTATGKLSLKVTYSDGTPSKTITGAIINTPSGSVQLPLTLTSAKVKSISVSATLNPGSGALNLDFLYAMYSRQSTVTRNAMLLTLPPAQ